MGLFFSRLGIRKFTKAKAFINNYENRKFTVKHCIFTIHLTKKGTQSYLKKTLKKLLILIL